VKLMRRDDITKRTDLKETRRKDVHWICLLQDRASGEFWLNLGSLAGRAGGGVYSCLSERLLASGKQDSAVSGVHNTNLGHKKQLRDRLETWHEHKSAFFLQLGATGSHSPCFCKERLGPSQ
jgi:hypothetical protein